MLGSSFYDYLELDENYMECETPGKSVKKLKTLGKPKRSLISPASSTPNFTPKKKQEAAPLEKPPKMDLHTMRLLKELAGSTDIGLTPRLVQKVFDRIKRKNLDVTVSCSFVQVHHENVIDLLPVEDKNQTIL